MSPQEEATVNRAADVIRAKNERIAELEAKVEALEEDLAQMQDCAEEHAKDSARARHSLGKVSNTITQIEQALSLMRLT